jgi:glycosyltransferase involved in cell wall biosynthesis
VPIYYLCPDKNNPVGGVRVIYRHVDILNKHHIPAYVVHSTPGFRVSWFENDTKITCWRNNKYHKLLERIGYHLRPNVPARIRITGGSSSVIDKSDILVIPERYGPDLADSIGRGIKKVVLNQNCYLTFKGFSFNKDRLIAPYGHKDVLATLINSFDGLDYLNYAFPDLPLYRFRLSIDPKRFYLQKQKKKQICFSRIKNEADAMQVINMLKFRGALKDYEIVPFINMPQSDVAQIYRDSLIFLSFGYPEGFGLPAAEAMACGCIVVGFHGGGGREFFQPAFSYPIDQGDIVGFAKTVEEVIRTYEREPEAIATMGKMASSYIHDNYSTALEEKEVVAAWNSILEAHKK